MIEKWTGFNGVQYPDTFTLTSDEGRIEIEGKTPGASMRRCPGVKGQVL